MRLLRWLVLLAMLAAVGIAGAAWWWLERPLPLASDAVEVSIAPGTSPRAVAEKWVQAGVQTPPEALWLYFRFSGKAPQMRAGNYRIERGITPP